MGGARARDRWKCFESTKREGRSEGSAPARSRTRSPGSVAHVSSGPARGWEMRESNVRFMLRGGGERMTRGSEEKKTDQEISSDFFSQTFYEMIFFISYYYYYYYY
jgi:hypothetical protein